MAQNREQTENDDEIMPPESGGTDAARGAGGARQLPPLIDQADGGVIEIYLIRPVQKFVARVTLCLQRLLRATLWLSLAIVFIYVGLVIWQVNRPAGDWAAGKRDWQALLSLTEIQILVGLKTADSGAATKAEAASAEISDAVPVDENIVVPSDLPAGVESSVTVPAMAESNSNVVVPADVAPINNDAALMAEQAAHQATKAALLAAQEKLSQGRNQQEDRGVAQKRTSARANLAELILRLDNGAEFSAVLANMRADGLLTANEVAALVPFAETGVNWSALILADYQRVKGQLSLTEQTPAPVTMSESPPPVLSWLHEWSRGLISLQRLPEMPPAVASEPVIGQIELALARQQYESASALLAQPEILTLMPAAPMLREQAMAARQELSARLMQAARHQAWLGQLKQDFLMGLRP